MAMGEVRHLIPHFILSQFAKQHISGRADVATLFVDISGFTAFTESFISRGVAQTELMAELMADLFSPLVQAVYGQGGFVSNFHGDGFTAIFEQDEEWKAGQHALAVAVEMHKVMATGRIVEAGYHLTLKIGVAQGDVDWQIVVNQQQGCHTYYFKGSAIDEAIRAEKLAGSGEIIVSRAVQLACTGMAQFAIVEPPEWAKLVTVVGPLPQAQVVALTDWDEQQVAFVPAGLHHLPMRGEFRNILSLFISLPGTPTPEQLNQFIQAVFARQSKYGGYLNTVSFDDKGHNLLLFWGAPTAFENDVERALNFVLELHDKTLIPFRAGITYRLMYVGFIGSSLRQEYSCYGQGVNLAARQMAAANWEEIWLDEETAGRAQSLFELKTLPLRQFKGFVNPQQVYQLHGPKATKESFYRGQRVGREKELNQLYQLIQPLFAGRFGGVITILGEAGMGKSRLAYELRQLLLSKPRPVVWFHCQTDQLLRRPLNPFRYWLGTYFQQSPTQDEATNKEAFDRRLEQLLVKTTHTGLAEELQRTRSFLGALVDLFWPDSLYEQVEPRLRLQNSLAGLKSLIKAESLLRPVIIQLEDVHWLDSDSHAFLSLLTRHVDEFPFVVVATSRPVDEQGRLRFSTSVRHSQIELQGLSLEATTALIADYLQSPADPGLVKLLHGRTEGNPFFIEQLCFYLRERGMLVESPTGVSLDVRFADGHTEFYLPTDIRKVLVARLDQLSLEVKQIVQTASVLGREFARPLLSQMMNHETQLSRKIRIAEEAAIWYPLNESRYLFKHPLLRDAAYEMQLRTRRRQLHIQAAQAITQLYGADLTSHYADLAYHYGQAQESDQERHFALLAGQQALTSYASEEALRYLNRALELLPAGDIPGRYTILLQRQKVYDLQGKRATQNSDLQTLAELANRLADTRRQIEVYLYQSDFFTRTSDYTQAIATAQEALWLATKDDPSHEAMACIRLGQALWQYGEIRPAQQPLERALTLYRQQNNLAGQGIALHNLGVVCNLLGNYEGSLVYYKESLHIRRQLNDFRGESSTINNLGNIYSEKGEHELAIDAYSQALRICQRIGDRQGESIRWLNLGNGLTRLGNFEQAQHYLERALYLSQEIGYRALEGGALRHLAVLAYRLERLDRALSLARQALLISREVQDRHYEAFALTDFGRICLDNGNLTEARVAFEQANQMRREMEQPHLMSDNWVGLIAIHLAQNNVAQAVGLAEMVDQQLKASPDLKGAEYPIWCYWMCYEAFRSGRDNRAVQVLQTADRLLQRWADKIQDQKLRRLFLNNIAEHRQVKFAISHL